jgi:5-methylcytosine-specific restriction endonuclease McrA
METRICRKCEIEKPITSFPRLYGRHAHLRERVCGMCKKRAHALRHPESKQMETWRTRARKMAVTLSEYLYLRVCRARRRAFKPIRFRKNRRTKCPLVAMNPKVDYQVNRDYHLKKSQRWSRNNPAKALEKKRRRRSRVAGVVHTLTAAEWDGIKRRFKNRCAYCDRKTKLTMDHVVPLAQGGDHIASNIVPACTRCNSSKGVGRPLRPVQTLLVA